MTDLTIDEFSPRNAYTEAQVIRECDQCAQAFDIAANMVLQMEAEERDSDGEPVESNEGRYYRYAISNLSEVSDPGFWYEAQGEQQDQADEQGAEPVEYSIPEDEPEGEEPQTEEEWKIESIDMVSSKGTKPQTLSCGINYTVRR